MTPPSRPGKRQPIDMRALSSGATRRNQEFSQLGETTSSPGTTAKLLQLLAMTPLCFSFPHVRSGAPPRIPQSVFCSYLLVGTRPYEHEIEN